MPTEDRTDDLLRRLGEGDEAACEELFPRVYGELRKLAGGQMARQPDGHTLQATALVNEAYLRIAGGAPQIQDREHFLRLAGRVMRQVLVDHARAKAADKRQLPPPQELPARHQELGAWVDEYERRSGGLLALDAALERLAERDPELVRLVELRFFAGSTMAETAGAMGISERSAARRWETARLVLRRELEG